MSKDLSILYLYIDTHRMSLTIDISSVVIDGIQTGSISGVPNSDCIIPRTYNSSHTRSTTAMPSLLRRGRGVTLRGGVTHPIKHTGPGNPAT